MNGKELIKALHTGERVYGTMIVSTSPHWPAAVKSTGADFVFIDTEHNIESTPALAALDDILAVPDIDAVQIGPHDLSCSLGVPEQYAHPRFEEAIQTIIAKAGARSVGVGVHYWWGIEDELRWVRAGANLIVHSGDIVLFADALRADLKRFREVCGDRAKRPRNTPSTY